MQSAEYWTFSARSRGVDEKSVKYVELHDMEKMMICFYSAAFIMLVSYIALWSMLRASPPTTCNHDSPAGSLQTAWRLLMPWYLIQLTRDPLMPDKTGT